MTPGIGRALMESDDYAMRIAQHHCPEIAEVNMVALIPDVVDDSLQRLESLAEAEGGHEFHSIASFRRRTTKSRS
jgi:hypothetical protein